MQSAVRFVLDHDLDGLDVDWEYPGLPGYGNTHRLTFAAGAFPDFLAHVEMEKVRVTRSGPSHLKLNSGFNSASALASGRQGRRADGSGHDAAGEDQVSETLGPVEVGDEGR